jgi:putative ABC transport system permease protein
MNLALRDIRHNLGRFVLTCLGLGLLLGVALAMVGIYRGVVDDALSLPRALGADLWVVEAGTRGPFAEASRIPGDVREAVARLPGVVAAGAIALQTAEVPRPSGRILRLQLVAYEPDRPGGPPPLLEGRGIARGRFEMVVDRAAGLPLGETLEMGGQRFRVVGLTRGAVSSGGDPLAWITLRDGQEMQFRLAPPAARRQIAAGGGTAGTDTVNAVIARLSPNQPVEALAAEVRRWKHLAALTAAEQEGVLTQSLVARARIQLGMFTVILLIASAVVVALIVYTLTLDKMREIATLKLIGARDRTIVGLILQQAMALGVVGLAGGASLLFSVKDFFPRRVALGLEEVAVFGLLVVAICLVASLLGVRLALRVEPAQALGG